MKHFSTLALIPGRSALHTSKIKDAALIIDPNQRLQIRARGRQWIISRVGVTGTAEQIQIQR